MSKNIIEAIEKDFTGRRGLRQEWEGIDEDIQEGARGEWEEIVKNGIKNKMPSLDIANSIASNMKRRSGLGNAFDDIDDEIVSEILTTWTTIIEEQRN